MTREAAIWHPGSDVRVRVEPQAWRLNKNVSEAMEKAWQEYGKRYFRGPVLSVVSAALDEVRTQWTDYAHFLYSSRHLRPDHPAYVRVLFAAGCLVTVDGWLLAALMSSSTSRPGWIQAVGGSPEREEVVDEYFDPVASVVRETREETGLDLLDRTIARQVGVVGYTEDRRDGSVAVAVKAALTLNHQEVLAQFQAYQAREGRTELDALVALPLGAEGVNRLQHYGATHVRYLNTLLMAPEMTPSRPWGPRP